MSRCTASLSMSSTGPTQLENTRWAIAGVLNSRIARLGKSATSSAWNSERPAKPENRSLTYVLKPVLLISPSLSTSMPASRCLAIDLGHGRVDARLELRLIDLLPVRALPDHVGKVIGTRQATRVCGQDFAASC